MPFEHRRQNVLPHHQFVRRLAYSAMLAVGVIGCSLLLGVCGYRYIGELSWVDSFENASMILSGMGPVNELHTSSAKVFAGCYALFSGIVFLSTAAILFAPLAHRLMHRFHVPTDQDEETDEEKKPRKKAK